MMEGHEHTHEIRMYAILKYLYLNYNTLRIRVFVFSFKVFKLSTVLTTIFLIYFIVNGKFSYGVV